MGFYCPASYYYYAYNKKNFKELSLYPVSMLFMSDVAHFHVALCLISSCKSKLPGLERRQN